MRWQLVQMKERIVWQEDSTCWLKEKNAYMVSSQKMAGAYIYLSGRENQAFTWKKGLYF